MPAAPTPPAVHNAAVPTPAAVRTAAAAPAAPTPAAVDEAAALAPVAAAAPLPAALSFLAAEGGESTPAAFPLAGADGAAVPTPSGADGGNEGRGRIRRAFAAAKKCSRKLVPKMRRRQPPGQEAPQVRHHLSSGSVPMAVPS